MTLITKRAAAKMLGVHYETYRRRKILGYYRDIKEYRPGKRCKAKVIKETVESHIEAHCE